VVHRFSTEHVRNLSRDNRCRGQDDRPARCDIPSWKFAPRGEACSLTIRTRMPSRQTNPTAGRVAPSEPNWGQPRRTKPSGEVGRDPADGTRAERSQWGESDVAPNEPNRPREGNRAERTQPRETGIKRPGRDFPGEGSSSPRDRTNPIGRLLFRLGRSRKLSALKPPGDRADRTQWPGSRRDGTNPIGAPGPPRRTKPTSSPRRATERTQWLSGGGWRGSTWQ
jgi:hypothetical protein